MNQLFDYLISTPYRQQKFVAPRKFSKHQEMIEWARSVQNNFDDFVEAYFGAYISGKCDDFDDFDEVATKLMSVWLEKKCTSVSIPDTLIQAERDAKMVLNKSRLTGTDFKNLFAKHAQAERQIAEWNEKHLTHGDCVEYILVMLRPYYNDPGNNFKGRLDKLKDVFEKFHDFKDFKFMDYFDPTMVPKIYQAHAYRRAMMTDHPHPASQFERHMAYFPNLANPSLMGTMVKHDIHHT